MKYRADIDGLRALAVLPVILSHIQFPGFAGGYIGVDIFFVISGFLITSTILSDVENNSFSIIKFFERRARRILPALFFVLICSFALFWQVMEPAAFKSFSDSLIAATLSVSNFYFLLTIDYFAPSALEIPLLHTWSLAIEEQFYLLFPLLFVFIREAQKRWLFIAGLAIMSFLLCLVGAHYFPSEAYYLLPTRAWELLAGALLAIVSRKRDTNPNEAGALFGLSLIVVSIFWLDEKVTYPSIYTLLPVVGTMLMIGCTTGTRFVAPLLSFRPFVAIGKLSFAAYLWHQPVFAFWRLAGYDAQGYTTKVTLIGAVFMLAFVTYHCVERPLRYMRLTLKSTVISTVIIGTLSVSIGLWGALGKGLPFRLPPQFNEFYKEVSWNRNCLIQVKEPQFELPAQSCVTGQKDSAFKIAIFGDSVASSLTPAIKQLFPEGQAQFTQLTYGGCAPIADTYIAERELTTYCGEVLQQGFAYLEERDFDAIILAAAWAEFFQYPSHFIDGALTRSHDEKNNQIRAKFLQTIDRLQAGGARVFLVDPVALVNFQPVSTMARRIMFLGDKANVSISNAEFDENVALAKSVLDIPSRDGLYRVDPKAVFCSDECYLGQNGKTYFADQYHYSHFGAVKIANELKPLFVSAGLLN